MVDDTDGSSSTDPSTLSNKSSFLYSSDSDRLDDSLIAVAGSNGVVVVWRAASLLTNLTTGSNPGLVAVGNSHASNAPFSRQSLHSRSSPVSAQPEAILVEHSRSVNRIVWHHRRPGLLITASQDSTVKLMERKPYHASHSKTMQGGNKMGGGIPGWLENLTSIVPSSKKVNTLTSFTWTCISTFTPRAEAIRDLQWSPFDDNGKMMVIFSLTL